MIVTMNKGRVERKSIHFIMSCMKCHIWAKHMTHHHFEEELNIVNYLQHFEIKDTFACCNGCCKSCEDGKPNRVQ